jgi:integrase
MSVRKRKWVISKGPSREAWIVDYRDAGGARCIETFERKKDADARHAEIRTDIRTGVHIAPSKSITVKEAGEEWLRTAESHGLERATLAQYRQHLNYHIAPFIRGAKLSELNAQTVRQLEDRLRREGRSPTMVRTVIVSLGAIVAETQERGLAARNAVRDLRRNRCRGKKHHAGRRQKGKLKVGVDIPSPDEIKAIVAHTKDHWRPLIITACFTGLRSSELRGLRWEDVDLNACELHVRQRSDRYGVIGKPKSAAGARVVPFGKFVANTLKEWKLACPHGPLRSQPAQEKLSAMRTCSSAAAFLRLLVHQPAAGWWTRAPPKVVRERPGHSTITMTYDRYGHLFPRGDDAG